MPGYSIPIGGSGEALEVKPGFFGSPITFQGQVLKTKFHWGYRSADVQTGDGQTHAIEIRPDYLDILPKIKLDGAEASYAPPQPTWAKALAVAAFLLFPLGFCLVGGAIAALIGAVAGYIVLYVAREMENKTTAILISIVSVVIAWGLWLALSIAVLAAMVNRGA